MKLYLIKASAPGLFKEYKKYMGCPPQNIFSAAAATPRSIKIDMCDETMDMKPDMKTDADLIAIFYHTPDAVHAYKMADTYKAKGKTVVLGGLHASFLPDEAQEHADAVIIGELEGIWLQLLKDFRDGALKRQYQRKGPVDMSNLRPYPTDIIPPSKYKNIWSVLVSRGCVHRCDFCVIPPFFNGKYRVRPIENIVAEIQAAPAKWFELHADNLTADRDYAIKLFKALIPLKIKWVGESTIKMAEDEELLRLAAESGCHTLLVGIETPSQVALKSSGKEFVSPEKTRDAIRKFHEYGIQITSSMIFGFDTHTTDIFQESVDFVNEIEIDEVESVILCPFAGTPLYKRLEKEGRLLTKDWSKYDCSQAVFTPKNMTPQQLEEGATWFWKQVKKKSPLSGGRATTSPTSDSFEKKSNHKFPKGTGSIKWKSILALCLIASALAFDMPWLWGILFIIWAVMDIKNSQTYLLEEIPRDRNPFLYWIIVSMWFCFALTALSWHPTVYSYVYEYMPAFELIEKKESSVDHPQWEALDKNKIAAMGHQKAEDKQVTQIKETSPPQIKKVVLPTQTQTKLQTISYGMNVTVPASWEVRKKQIPDGLEISSKDPDGKISLTCLRYELGQGFNQSSFIRMVEKDTIRDLDFLDDLSGKEMRLPYPHSRNFDIKFKQYTGTLKGTPVLCIVGYGVQKTQVYIVVAIYMEKDKTVLKKLLQAIYSFKPE